MRQQLNKPQSEIAKEMGISIPAYSKMETGQTQLNVSRLYQLAKLFKVSIESLIGENDFEGTTGESKIGKDQLIADLQNQVSELQRKLINAYEQNFNKK